MNLQEKINDNQSFSASVFRDRSYKLETVSLIFSICNPFPSSPSAGEDTYFYYYSTSGIILKKTGPLFLGFHRHEYVFWLFKVTLKMVTEPL